MAKKTISKNQSKRSVNGLIHWTFEFEYPENQEPKIVWTFEYEPYNKPQLIDWTFNVEDEKNKVHTIEDWTFSIEHENKIVKTL